MSKYYSENFLACEAKEAHDFLDSKNVPRIKIDPEGNFENERGKYHIMPLIDRIIFYSKEENKKSLTEHRSLQV